jgi:FeS assembly SUF system regulator
MLRISKLTDYGTVVMVCLAKRAPALSSARDIAEATHLQMPTVSKLLKRLTAAGLLLSTRGVTGGYRLQRDASEISVAQIIYALDGQRGLTECSQKQDACVLHRVCHIQNNWRAISAAIESALDSVSLEALAMSALPAVNLQTIKQLATGVHHGE